MGLVVAVEESTSTLSGRQRPKISIRSNTSRLTVRTQRSEWAFAQGSERQPDDRHPLALEHLIEASAELRVSVGQQESRLQCSVLKYPGQVPGLLHHPLRARVVGAAAECTRRLPTSMKKMTCRRVGQTF